MKSTGTMIHPETRVEKIKSVNPFNGEVLASYDVLTTSQLDAKLELAEEAFQKWRHYPIKDRAVLISVAGEVLRENKERYARMITQEMGKPITESKAEIDKCAWACDYYGDHAEMFLQPENIETDATESYVRYDPLGTILGIMPWNFPFWQVFRFAAPVLTAGNAALLKHAFNVQGCADMIEEVFERAGYPKGVFQNLVIHHDQAGDVIAHHTVKGVSLTGSERAGSAVAELAGRHLKKTVLELGGSNAFIVLDDANVELAVKKGVAGRMINSGQSCIAAKRFIITDGIYDEFMERFLEQVALLRTGDPADKQTQVGPLARADLAEQLNRQVQESLRQGAMLLAGGNYEGCMFEPTILGNVTPQMPVFMEETFGPVAAFIRVSDMEEALRVSELSTFGLGLTVCTNDISKARSIAARTGDGACFVNEMVKSDPRLPFGGTKHSGYGRELSKEGLLEFVNRKTVYMSHISENS